MEAPQTYCAPQTFAEFELLDKAAHDHECAARAHWDRCLAYLDRTGRDIARRYGACDAHYLELDDDAAEGRLAPAGLWQADPLGDDWPLWADYRHIRYGSQPAAMAGYLVASRLAIDAAGAQGDNRSAHLIRLAVLTELSYANFVTAEWSVAARNLIGSFYTTIAEKEQIAQAIADRRAGARHRLRLRLLHGAALRRRLAESGLPGQVPADAKAVDSLAALLAALSSEPASDLEFDDRFEALDIVAGAARPFHPAWGEALDAFFPVI